MKTYIYCVSKKLEDWLNDELQNLDTASLFSKLGTLEMDKNGVTCSERFNKKVELNTALKEGNVNVATKKRRGYTIVEFQF